ncbi:MAG: TetR/AcrR family transcriptional regulator C-terminal domain-containing protein [Lachnospiraceae bacterium]|nr:TetR/AcrR family transcriptional regulator C-terminal domain-containing protein [Lachnospiraceae bacterium]
MNKKENRRVKMTRQLLSESLLELLQTEDIHKISIRALCEKADVNRSTFYKYYGSQYDLLEEMEDTLISEIGTILDSSKKDLPFKEKMTIILHFAKDHAHLVRIMLNGNVDPDFPNRLFSLPAIDKRMNKETLFPASAEGIYLQDFLFYGGYQIFRRWINSDFQESPEQMAEIISNIFHRFEC